MNAPTCQICGQPLPPDAPQGICPACLLQRTLGDAPPAPQPPEMELQQLETAFPQLDIEEMIGQGGMGRVYRARQPHLNRMVALKVLSAERVNDPEWLERFNREARALARLSHPHIVQVYDFGEKPVPYLLMEHVEGVNLRGAMQQGGLTAREALAIVPKLCDALQYAHEHGVLHRDIKPENILIDTEGRVKLVDFGLAKLREENVLPFTLTQSGARLGTLAYMAPEQVEKPGDVDHRADIYSLGVVLYEMLTGELPLGRFPAPSEANGVDARLDNVVMRTLEKHREKRFQSADEIKTSLAAAEKAPLPSQKRTSHPARGFIVGMAALLVVGLGLWAPGRQADRAFQQEKAARLAAEKLRTEWQKKYDLEKPIRDKAQAWISRATRADKKEGQQQVLQEIREAMQSKDEITQRTACTALEGLYQIEFDRVPFRDLARGLLESKSPDVRATALHVLSNSGMDETDRARLDQLAATCTDGELSSLLWAYHALFQKDFTGANSVPVLKLLERGVAAAQRDGGSMWGIDSRHIFGVIWGSKISPEIEARLVEWSHLDEDAQGDMLVGNSYLGYNAFYHALSVMESMSRVTVERMLQLAYHPDTTNVSGRSLSTLPNRVRDPADQAYAAGEVIRLLGLRHDEYLWKGGLTVLQAYATRDHVAGLQELSKRETISVESKKTLEEILLRLQRPS